VHFDTSEQGGFAWLAPLILVIYNLVRLFVTYRVSFLRDSEERTGYSARQVVRHQGASAVVDTVTGHWHERMADRWRKFLLSFSWLNRLDRVLSVLFFVSLFAFDWHVTTWLRMTIWLPQ
jgi:hypothetical protein